MLGNPSPSVAQTSSPAAAAPAPVAADLASCEKKASTDLGLVDGDPTTNVQVVFSTFHA